MRRTWMAGCTEEEEKKEHAESGYLAARGYGKWARVEEIDANHV
jgi:hypothetical protein